MAETAVLAPGPWTWDGEYPITIKANGYYVVSGGIMPSGAANARLIAAAPDLLEALRLAHDHLATVGTYEGSEELAQIRAALDKAEGK